ncbi:probable Bet1-like protein At4g14600 [Coccomyxa sp. Obi]|nr:probable Bet1-like protein At4g14600 [Coccomyxa sp. Obi]
MAFRSGGFSRDGLSTRAYAQSDQAQISIELGEGFDLDNEIDGLRSQVGRLKEMSRAIGEENKLQRQQAESLEELMERAKTDLKRGMRRLNRAFQQSRSNHLLYLVIFCIAVFFFLYMWAKMFRMVRWLS